MFSRRGSKRTVPAVVGKVPQLLQHPSCHQHHHQHSYKAELHCLQLFKRAKASSRQCASSNKHMAASLQAELESEKQHHAATAACLQQEQEMLAMLGTRLAAVETAAAESRQLQRELQTEQQLHDVSLTMLIQQRADNELLKQQLGAGSSGRTAGGARTALAVKAACMAAGVAAAAALPGLLAPGLTALLAAEASAAALGSLGAHRHRHLLARGVASTCADPPAPSTARAAPASFNCWEQGDVYVEAADSIDEAAACDPSLLPPTPSAGAAGNPWRGWSPDTVICADDDVQSAVSFDDVLCGRVSSSSSSSSTSSMKLEAVFPAGHPRRGFLAAGKRGVSAGAQEAPLLAPHKPMRLSTGGQGLKRKHSVQSVEGGGRHSLSCDL